MSPNPFAPGTFARAVITARELLAQVDALKDEPWQLFAMVRLHVRARALRNITGTRILVDPIVHTIDETLAFRSHCSRAPHPALCPAQQLREQLSAEPNLDLLGRMAAGLFRDDPATPLHTVEMEVRAGRLDRALWMAEMIPPSEIKNRALLLARTGVVVRRGRHPSRRFVGRLDDSDRFLPSMAQLVEAAVQGRVELARALSRRVRPASAAAVWVRFASSDFGALAREKNRSVARYAASLRQPQRDREALWRAALESELPGLPDAIRSRLREGLEHHSLFDLLPSAILEAPFAMDPVLDRLEQIRPKATRPTSGTVDRPAEPVRSPVVDLFEMRLILDRVRQLRIHRRAPPLARDVWWRPAEMFTRLRGLALTQDGWAEALPDAVKWRSLVDRFDTLQLEVRHRADRDRALSPESAFSAGLVADCTSVDTYTPRLRAFFDRGLAWSAEARRRRRALVEASLTTLRTTFGKLSTKPDAEIVAQRLHIVSVLGGDSAAQGLAQLLVAVPHHPHQGEVFASLCGLDLRRAVETLMTRFTEVSRSGVGRALLDQLTERGALSKTYPDQWMAALRATPYGWLSRFSAEWFRQTGQPVRASVLRAIVQGIFDMQTAPEEQVCRAFGQARALNAETPGRLIVHLIRRPRLLETSVSFLSPCIPGAREWSSADWTRMLDLVLKSDRVAPDVVGRYAAHLDPAAPRAMADRLLHGRHPVGDQNRRVPLKPNWSLRFLDKTKDLFLFLRFADAVPCCFNSASRSYASEQVNGRRQIMALWKDPLSFCFSIERRHRSWSEHHGFVFGSFGTEHGRPVVLLNGVYLRRFDRELRMQALAMVEASFCRPLDIAAIGVGNSHGGKGALPKEFALSTRPVCRWRALRDRRGRLLRTLYDDIGQSANREAPTTLFWKNLRPNLD